MAGGEAHGTLRMWSLAGCKAGGGVSLGTSGVYRGRGHGDAGLLQGTNDL